MSAVSAEQRKAWMDEFVKDFVLNVDLYASCYCGYWLRGEGVIEDDSWLAADMLEVCKDQTGKTSNMVVDLSEVDERAEDVARLALAGELLPKGWHVINRTVGEKAYAIGERRWGEDWMATKGDSGTYDIVVQEALLGEVRYG
jgi:hypothetical protein